MALEIKVRAVPDTSKFKQELDAAIGNLKPIKIPVGIDIDSESKRILD